MTTLGISIPAADPTVKYGVETVNKIFDLIRKHACSSEPGLKEFHRSLLFGIEKNRELYRIRERGPFDEAPPCDQLTILSSLIDEYKGPKSDYFDEFKALLLQIEADIIELACSDNKLDFSLQMDNLERIIRSSYKSICNSEEELLVLDPEMAITSLRGKAERVLNDANEAAAVVEEKSKISLEPAKDVVRNSVSCPSGISVITSHWHIAMGVFLLGVVTALILRRRPSVYHSPRPY